MDYTKNYHLPQWKKDDRIIMEDFNAAMAGIEDGLDQASREARAAAQTANAAVTPASFQSGLLRAAYNHYWLLSCQDALPWQLGVLRQSFAEGAGGSTTGFMQRGDRVWTGNGEEELTLEHVRSSFSQVQAMSPTQGTMILEFTTPHPGRLRQITVSGHTVNHGGDPGNCTLRLLNRTGGGTGVLEEEQRASFNLKTGSTAGYFRLPMDLVVHAGQKYRLEIVMDNLNAQAEFVTNRNISECLVFTGMQVPSASAVCRLRSDEKSQGGVALVYYTYAGAKPSLTLNWDGETLSPYKIRTVTNAKGRACLEAAFRRTTVVPENSTLTLKAEIPTGSDLSLYEMGAVLI